MLLQLSRQKCNRRASSTFLQFLIQISPCDREWQSRISKTKKILPMSINYNGWHVLYVRSQHEKKVHDLLLNSSLESFLPLVKTNNRWSDREKVIFKPLFPSYVFVNIHSSADFYKALGVNGVCAYIRFGQEYAKVPKPEIEKIKFVLGLENVTDVKTDSALPKVGDVKKITYGLLNGLECEVIRVNNENKVMVRVSIDSIQQNISITMPANALLECEELHPQKSKTSCVHF